MPSQQMPGEQYIHQSDGHEETGEELYCVFDATRICAADCVGYDPDGVGNDARTTCLMVNAWKQTAIGIVNMVRTAQQAEPLPGSQERPPKVNS